MNYDKRPLRTDEVEAYVDAANAVLDLRLPGEFRASVVSNLQRLMQMSQLFVNFRLPEQTEVAPVFKP